MSVLLGVIGDPIAHSLSPVIHNGWLKDAGIDGLYEAIHVPDGAFDSALKDLTKNQVVGVNVTLPHKHAALAAADYVSDAAQAIGAVNTLTQHAGGVWHADNTDAPGFLMALGDADPDKESALVLGAGGSARAIVFALTNAGFDVIVLNRTPEKAAKILQDFGVASPRYDAIDQYNEYIESATIVVNTTSMGHAGEIVDLPDGGGRTFFDLSYGHVAAAQLTHAREQGWQTRDGLAMLVAQAALSFEIWFGHRPSLQDGLARAVHAMEAGA